MSTDLTQAQLDQLKAIKEASCYPYTPDFQPSYGYFPSFAAGVIFSIFFAIPFFYHTFQSIRLRATTSILLALGALSTSLNFYPPFLCHK